MPNATVPANAATTADVLAKLIVTSGDVATFVEDFADGSQAEFALESSVCDALPFAGDPGRLAAFGEALGLAAP